MPPKKNDNSTFIERAKKAHGREPVKVPGMDGEEVFAKALSAAEIRSITNACRKPGAAPEDEGEYDDNLIISMVMCTSIVDKSGCPLIPIEDAASIDEVLPNSVKLALQAAALKMNGMGTAAGGND